MECPSCNADNADGVVFCVVCGANLPKSNPNHGLSKGKMAVFHVEEALLSNSAGERIARRKGLSGKRFEREVANNLEKAVSRTGVKDFVNKLGRKNHVIAFISSLEDSYQFRLQDRLRQLGYPVTADSSGPLVLMGDAAKNIRSLGNRYDIVFSFGSSSAAAAKEMDVPGVYATVNDYIGDSKNPYLAPEPTPGSYTLSGLHPAPTPGPYTLTNPSAVMDNPRVGVYSSPMTIALSFAQGGLGKLLKEQFAIFDKYNKKHPHRQEQFNMQIYTLNPDGSKHHDRNGRHQVFTWGFTPQTFSNSPSQTDIGNWFLKDPMYEGLARYNNEHPISHWGISIPDWNSVEELEAWIQAGNLIPERPDGPTPMQPILKSGMRIPTLSNPNCGCGKNPCVTYGPMKNAPIVPPGPMVSQRPMTCANGHEFTLDKAVRRKILGRRPRTGDPAENLYCPTCGEKAIIDLTRPVRNPPPKPRRQTSKKTGKKRRESAKKYFDRLMGNKMMNEEFPDNSQRSAVALRYVKEEYGQRGVNSVTKTWSPMTNPTTEGLPIYSGQPTGAKNLGMVSAVVQVGRGFMKDIGEGLQDFYRALMGGRQSMTEKRMMMAVAEMHRDLTNAVEQKGGNAIGNVRLDYEYPAGGGRSLDLTLIATADALKVPKKNPAKPAKVKKAKDAYKKFHGGKTPDEVTTEKIDVGDVWYSLGECWTIGYKSPKENGDEDQKFIHEMNEESKDGNFPTLYATMPESGEPMLIIKGGSMKIGMRDGKAWLID